jgi:DNA-binding CsgD family transcriptional regulator
MTEEERLDYIKKHPIVPTEKPKEAKFSTDAIDFKVNAERKREAFKGKKVIDKIDKNHLHRLFIQGKTLLQISDALGISATTVNNYIHQQRKSNPEKWPYRSKK